MSQSPYKNSKNKNSFVTGQKDDIYNISVRKKAVRLLSSAIENLVSLNQAYLSYIDTAVYNKFCGFIRENRQIAVICKSAYKLLSKRNYGNALTDSDRKKIKDAGKKYSSSLLIYILNDLLAAATLTEGSRFHTELTLCCYALAKQLLFIKTLQGNH